MLKHGDGQCGAWARLFIDIRKIQGIDDYNEFIVFRPIPSAGIPQDYVRIAVKNGVFSGAGSSGNTNFPYLNIPDTQYIGATGYNWLYSEAHDAAGVPGQGNPNPASLFNNHQAVLSGEYYDPAYGNKYPSLLALDNSAIDGYCMGPISYPVDEPAVNLDLNNDGDKTDIQVYTTVFLFRKNTTGLDIWEDPSDE